MTLAHATIEIPGYLTGTWKADPVHSEIGFSVRHLMINKMRGRFTAYDVTILTGEDLLGSTGVRPTGDGWVIDGELMANLDII